MIGEADRRRYLGCPCFPSDGPSSCRPFSISHELTPTILIGNAHGMMPVATKMGLPGGPITPAASNALSHVPAIEAVRRGSSSTCRPWLVGRLSVDTSTLTGRPDRLSIMAYSGPAAGV
ncbi:uncharacterized protein LDX57_001635 [Aspergillus melleus]|uniref:uncharacterized protein n=1 Tax=Aspergillus melleus TaxID=138277 RepID=UPI001E8E0721|nr:uncharacterized protein LDX57_001635 [Aspergillus melleus]KAH8423883.1 hypothetical protein LDX57_001635 [Aspergillus melleus]